MGNVTPASNPATKYLLNLLPPLLQVIFMPHSCGILAQNFWIVLVYNTQTGYITNTTNVNLILSHVNHTFFILDPRIGPQAFRHTHCTLEIFYFFNVKKGSIQGSICFKVVPGLLILGPLSKVAPNHFLRTKFLARKEWHDQMLKTREHVDSTNKQVSVPESL
jgi:hypothetical protein